MEQWKNISSNPYAWLLTVLTGIISVVLAYRSTPQKKIKCDVVSNKLITNNQSAFSKLNISYNGEQVERLTITKVIFWNSTFPSIRKEDLIEKAPFAVTISSGKILDLSVLEGKDTPNEINIDYIDPKDENNAKISFNYLNHKDGGVVQVVHTGNEKSINISKELVGGKIVVLTNIKKYVNKVLWIIFLSMMVLVLLLLATNDIDILPQSWYISSGEGVMEYTYSPFILTLDSILLIVGSIFLAIADVTNNVPKNCKKRNKIRKSKAKVAVKANTESEDGSLDQDEA